MFKVCKCRNCGSMYDPNKSRADFTGYCSQGCMHEKSKSLGYKKPKDRFQKDNEYEILKSHKAIGNIDKFGEACDYMGIPLKK